MGVIGEIGLVCIRQQIKMLEARYDSDIALMNVEMSIRDPAAQAVPLKLLGKIKRLNFALDWAGKEPVQDKGGKIENLHWVGGTYQAMITPVPKR